MAVGGRRTLHLAMSHHARPTWGVLRLELLSASAPEEHARDEGAAGGEVHALVAAGRGGEEAIKRGADLLGRAQAPHLRC